MRDAIDVHVDRAIVHIIDRDQAKPVVSDLELTLKTEPKLQDYFDAQVRNALADPAGGAAKFNDRGDSTVQKICLELIRNQNLLIPSSQKLAGRLSDAMGTDRRIAGGSLVVCLFSASNYRGKTFLALIKIDPSEALAQKIEKDRRGRRLVSFDIRADVMPRAQEKLQKAALIPPRRREADYDLLLLDRQVAKVAADFFAIKFLNAQPTLDAHKRTELFYVGTVNAYNRLIQPPQPGQAHVTPSEADVLLEQINMALQTQTIDTIGWADGLRLPDPAKQIIKEEIETQLPVDRQFNVDAEFAQKLIKKIRLRGDYGVLIEMDAEYRDQVIKSEEDFVRPDNKPAKRFVVEVSNIRWVKK